MDSWVIMDIDKYIIYTQRQKKRITSSERRSLKFTA